MYDRDCSQEVIIRHVGQRGEMNIRACSLGHGAECATPVPKPFGMRRPGGSRTWNTLRFKPMIRQEIKTG